MSTLVEEQKSNSLHHDAGYKVLVIGQPLAGKDVPKPTYSSCVNMFSALNLIELLTRYKVVTKIKILSDFPIDANRNRFVRESIEEGADYIFFMDMDQTFPSDTLLRLFETISDEKPIVSGMYYLKAAAYTPVMGRYVDWDDDLRQYKDVYDKLGFVHPDGRQLAMWRSFTYFDQSAPFQADVIGLGCVLMKTDIFKKLPPHPEKGWFFYTPDPRKGKEMFTMDEVMPFAALCKKNDITIWIDPRVQCGHLTQIESNIEMFESFRDTTFAEDARKDPERFDKITKRFIDVREEQKNGLGASQVVYPA